MARPGVKPRGRRKSTSENSMRCHQRAGAKPKALPRKRESEVYVPLRGGPDGDRRGRGHKAPRNSERKPEELPQSERDAPPRRDPKMGAPGGKPLGKGTVEVKVPVEASKSYRGQRHPLKRKTWSRRNQSEGSTTSSKNKHTPVPISHRPVLPLRSRRFRLGAHRGDMAPSWEVRRRCNNLKASQPWPFVGHHVSKPW